MGYLLYREVRDNAPAGWTANERLVAWAIADDANDETRKSWIKVPKLMEQTGFRSERGLRMVLQKLADSGYEFRVPICKDKQGRPVFAVKGRSLDFLVPRMGPPPVGGTDVPPKDPQGGTDVPPKAIKEEQMFPVGGTDVPPLSSQSSPHKDQKKASRRAQPPVARATLTTQEQIDAVREAGELVYGTREMEDISDDELGWLFDDKASGNLRAATDPRRIGSYFLKIFGDTPHIDTLLAGLDPGDDPDDYDLAESVPRGTDRAPRHVIPNTVICPRCDSTWRGAFTESGVCSWCEGEMRDGGGVPVEGWNKAILTAVRTALFVAVGKSMPDDWCAKVADQILSGKDGRREVRNPVQYVTKVIADDPNPSRFAPTSTPPNTKEAS